MSRSIKGLSSAALVAGLLYLFLVSIDLMGISFKLLGGGFSQRLMQATSNPFVALFSALLATSIIQSSSATTAMIVSMVSAGTLSVHNAVPMVMGANIGTTITSALASLGHVTRKEEFRRAFGGATMHDFFNLLVVAVLLPVELSTRFLERTATAASLWFDSSTGLTFTSPVKAVVRPVCDAIKRLVVDGLGIEPQSASIPLLAISFILLFTALFFLVKVMRAMVIGRAESLFDRVIFRSGTLALVMGLVFTALVQSSSITTSILIPMIGAGLLTHERAFPVTLGANVGTTVTALLAALTGSTAGLAIALVHLFFNLTGILIFYPFRPLRMVPIRLAQGLAGICAERRWIALVFILTVFFLVPLTIIVVSKNCGM